MRRPRTEDLPYLLQKETRTVGANLIKFKALGDGADARTILSRLDEVISVKDFGAVGDGYTDDYQSIQNALYASVDNSVVCYIPGGNYVVGTPIKVPDNSRIIGEGYLSHLLVDITNPKNIFTSEFQTTALMDNVVIGRLRLDGQRKNRNIIIPATRTRANALIDVGQSPSLVTGYGTNLWLFELWLQESIHFHISVEGMAGIHIWECYISGDGFDADGANYIGNTDGIHLVNCRDFIVDSCEIHTGDDMVAMTNDVNGCIRGNINNITGSSGYGNGVACVADATGTSGDIYDINISNISFTVSRAADDTGNAVRIRKTGTGTGTVHDVNISNVCAKGSATAAAIQGLAIMGRVAAEPVYDIACSNIQVENSRGHGIYVYEADDILLSNIRTKGSGQAAGNFNGIHLENCNRVVINNAICRSDDDCGLYATTCGWLRMDNVLVWGALTAGNKAGIYLDTCTLTEVGPGCFVTDGAGNVTQYGLVTAGTCSGVIHAKHQAFTCATGGVGVLNIDNAGKLFTSPGQPIVWCRFTDSGAAATLGDTEGIASITRTAQGDYTFVYNTNLTLYAVANAAPYLVTGSGNTGVNNADVVCKPVTHSAGSVRVKFTDGAGALAAVTEGFIQIFGMIDTA